MDDGYDLKYFNYSNLSVIERSKFHGLSEAEGIQVASYIRSLKDVPNPGRPWNPPYQPGPGLDQLPVNRWAAGAGVEWVLEDDNRSLDFAFPQGIPREVDLTRQLNVREIPVAFELPVWNHWLPRIHPLDYYGDVFDSGSGNSVRPLTAYAETVAALTDLKGIRGKPALEIMDRWNLSSAYVFSHGFISPAFLGKHMPPERDWSVRDNLARYSVEQWLDVKTWGLMRRFELEDQAQLGHEYFSPPSPAKEISPRQWHAGSLFVTAPHMLHMTQQGNGVRNGGVQMWNYFSASWYWLQMILDNNSRRGDGNTHWPYMTAFAGVSAGKSYGGSTSVLALIKMMEAFYNDYTPRQGPEVGWSGNHYPHLMGRLSPSSGSRYDGMSPEQRIQITEMLLRTYLKRTKSYPREELLAASACSNPVSDLGPHADSPLFNQRYYHVTKALSELKEGQKTIDPALVNEFSDFGKVLWPELASQFNALRK